MRVRDPWAFWHVADASKRKRIKKGWHKHKVVESGACMSLLDSSSSVGGMPVT